MTKDEAMKLAQPPQQNCKDGSCDCCWKEPAQQCKWPACQREDYQQALAEQIKRELVGEQPAQQEPVAWSSFDILTGNVKVLWGGKPTLGPLYTTPAQRKPLTYEEITAISKQVAEGGPKDSIDRFVRAIEDAHGIKE
jgi:hypothetical protein